MSKSSLPRSSIAARLRQDSRPARQPAEHGHPRSFRRRLGIRFAALARWLHIYLSMFGLAAVLFFSVTGVTLNHPDWFYAGAVRDVQIEGQMNLKWLHLDPPEPGPPSADATDLTREIARLEVVEHLRQAHGVRGALTDLRADRNECLVTFKGPGYSADAFIDRETGRYTLTQSYHGFIAVVNDLHKGRDTGKGWSILIDVSAVLMAVIALSGLVLLFYLKLRRWPGLAVALVGGAAVVAVFVLFVP